MPKNSSKAKYRIGNTSKGRAGMNPALAKTRWHYIYLLNNKVKARKQFSQAKVETWSCQESKGGVKNE